MDRKRPTFLAELAQTRAGLSLLRMASLLAEMEAEPDEEALGVMFEQADAGLLLDVAPCEIWPELARGLMARSPSRMIRILREIGALPHVLPEVAELFGVPQIADDPSPVDIGAHLLKALDEAALCGAPLAARFALLLMNVGKADSPREHLPFHYRHIERGTPRAEAICDRLGAPAECRALALLALAECERVHRVSRARAGPVASMLERLGAFDAAGPFAALMVVCACDYRAYGDRSGLAYPKAALLEAALQACEEVGAPATSADDAAMDALRSARAAAIARAFHSQRWSDEAS